MEQNHSWSIVESQGDKVTRTNSHVSLKTIFVLELQLGELTTHPSLNMTQPLAGLALSFDH